MLVFQVSVGGDKYLKACRFSYCNERAILQACPTELKSGLHLVTVQRAAQRNGYSLVKGNFHLRRFKRAALGVLQNGPCLWLSEARKPSQKIVQGRFVFEILEERGYRHTRATKYPSSAHACGFVFNVRAGRPINDGRHASTGLRAQQR